MVTAVTRWTFALTFLLAASAHAAPIDVNTCGQVFQGRGVLTTDLDCTGITAPAIQMNGRLDLQGHTLTGGGSNVAIDCISKCKIVGPGTITNPGATGVFSRHHVAVKDVTLTNLAVGADVDGRDLDGRRGKGSATFERCTITADGTGIFANVPTKLTDTTISGVHRWGVVAAPSSFNDGSACTHVPLFLKRSSVDGTTDDPICTDNICANVITCGRPPKLVQSTCRTSCQGGTGVPCTSWGICTDD